MRALHKVKLTLLQLTSKKLGQHSHRQDKRTRHSWYCFANHRETDEDSTASIYVTAEVNSSSKVIVDSERDVTIDSTLSHSSSGIFHCYFTYRSDDSDFRDATRRAREQATWSLFLFSRFFHSLEKKSPDVFSWSFLFSCLLEQWMIPSRAMQIQPPVSEISQREINWICRSSLVSSLVFEAASRPRN